jgi:glycyl-tRNA synthetase alpha chain
MLDTYWSNLGYSVVPSYDGPVGAATFHPQTFVNAVLGNKCKLAFAQKCRRPSDSILEDLNTGLHLNSFLQYQVICAHGKGHPHPQDVLELYEGSLEYLQLDLKHNDFKYIEDDWSSPSLGAFGRGWEVALNGLEITQITYFDRFAGEKNCSMSEIAYGVERLALAINNSCSYADLQYDDHLPFVALIKQEERDHNQLHTVALSSSNTTYAEKDIARDLSLINELLDKELFYPAYDLFVLLNNKFNFNVANVDVFQHSHYKYYMHSITALAVRLAKVLKALNDRNDTKPNVVT